MGRTRLLGLVGLWCGAALSVDAALIDLTGVSVAGETVGASSTEFGPENPREAFDNNPGLRWASGNQTTDPDPQWLWVDLGADYEIEIVRIAWETAHSADYTLRTRTEAQGFADPDAQLGDWTTIATVVGRTGGGDGDGATYNDEFNFDTPGFNALSGSAASSSLTANPIGRYLLIHSTARATIWGNSIWEVQVFGAEAVPEPTSLVLLALGGTVVTRRR